VSPSVYRAAEDFRRSQSITSLGSGASGVCGRAGGSVSVFPDGRLSYRSLDLALPRDIAGAPRRVDASLFVIS
jgi:hypothetical protein